VLRDREKFILLLGGIAAAVILLLSFVVVPGVARVRTLSRQLTQAESDLAELRKMRPELEQADREVRISSGRVTGSANAADSPHARLTAALLEAGFPQSSFSLKSGGVKDGEFFREEAFDFKIENLTYLEAIKIVTRFETGPLPIAIRSVQMKSRYDDGRYIDATFRIGFLLPLTR